MVRTKMSSKPPPYWKNESPAAKKRQQRKKGRQSKVVEEEVEQEDESWLILPEPVAYQADSDAVMQTELIIPALEPDTPLHAAMEKIPVGEIKVVAQAEFFVVSTWKAGAIDEIHDAAEVVLDHLAVTIMGDLPVGQQYEFLMKQFKFMAAMIDALLGPKKPVAEKSAPAKPAAKRVRELREPREGARRSKRIRLATATEDAEITARLSPLCQP
ncbi:hypothetical protein B0T09DRAFT_289875 [Sordaria sp. MPI-SDFR-AT-0083]|nr:hypothetical protein B0T09DRAFT_289875 [Sordaria sp. MPI-SDFR-AT-0083]